MGATWRPGGDAAGGDFDLPSGVQHLQDDFETLHLEDAPDRCFGEEVQPIEQDIHR